MLDIGCNKGFILVKGIEHNFEPYGVELVPVLMNQFKNKYPQFKNNIYSNNFSEISHNFQNQYFDIIAAIDVIEHFQNPKKDLENVFRILKTNGIFIVQTPDTDSEMAKLKGSGWGVLKAFEHL